MTFRIDFMCNNLYYNYISYTFYVNNKKTIGSLQWSALLRLLGEAAGLLMRVVVAFCTRFLNGDSVLLNPRYKPTQLCLDFVTLVDVDCCQRKVCFEMAQSVERLLDIGLVLLQLHDKHFYCLCASAGIRHLNISTIMLLPCYLLQHALYALDCLAQALAFAKQLRNMTRAKLTDRCPDFQPFEVGSDRYKPLSLLARIANDGAVAQLDMRNNGFTSCPGIFVPRLHRFGAVDPID